MQWLIKTKEIRICSNDFLLKQGLFWVANRYKEEHYVHMRLLPLHLVLDEFSRCIGWSVWENSLRTFILPAAAECFPEWKPLKSGKCTVSSGHIAQKTHIPTLPFNRIGQCHCNATKWYLAQEDDSRKPVVLRKPSLIETISSFIDSVMHCLTKWRVKL